MTTLSYGLNNLIHEVETSQYKGKRFLICQHDGWHVTILGGSNKAATAHNILNECYAAGWHNAAIHTLESLYISFLMDLRHLAKRRQGVIEAGVDTGFSIIEYKDVMFLPGASRNKLHCPRGCSKLIFLNKNHWETNDICEEIANSCDARAYRMDYNSVILPGSSIIREEETGLWIGVGVNTLDTSEFVDCQEVAIRELRYPL